MAKRKNAVVVPMVHMNGTGKARLEEELLDCLEAVVNAEHALERAYPHARDYYVMDMMPGRAYSLNTLAREHASKRMEALAQVRMELEAILEGVYDGRAGLREPEGN